MSGMETSHLFLDLPQGRLKVKGGLEIVLGRHNVELRNHAVTVNLSRSRDGKLYAKFWDQLFLVQRYHVGYNEYPILRQALKP